MSSTSTKYNAEKMFYVKTSFLFFLLSFLYHPSSAQYNLQVTVKSFPSTHVDDTVFAAGSFNNWNPADEKYKFVKTNGVAVLNINGLKGGVYPFKFTRGDWKKVESTTDGRDIGNRELIVRSDTSVEFSIAGWKDDFPEPGKPHTVSSNVILLDSIFFMPQLYRARTIRIYLPPDYTESKKNYPVLYMHDGQNLFDEYTAGFGEWGIDECLDSLAKKGMPGCIVVGIDNGPKRLNEYNPYDNAEYGNGEGELYVRFLVETLKPFIDKNYRALSSREHTIIAGSSLGGLISYYAMLRYPNTFGKGGIFSPSFWIAPAIKQLTDSIGNKMNGQLFFLAGELESGSMIGDMRAVTDKLGENSGTLIYVVTDPQGRHHETTWRKWFEEFYLWITGNGLSYQIKTGN